MARNYPRKQTLFIFFICLILVFGTSVLVNGWPSTKKQVSYNNFSEKTIVIANDAVADTSEQEWQKNFFNDTQVNTKGAKDVQQAKISEKLTPTDLFGRNFFTKYTELRQSGLSDNANAIESVANDLINQSLSGIKGANLYTLKDINTTYKSDIETTKKYAEDLMLVLSKWMPAVNEVEIVTNALESGDMDLLKQIDPIIVGYKNAINKLKVMSVPDVLALPHLDLINGISMQIFNAESLRNADKDPLTSLAAVSMEVKSLETIANAIGRMQTIFANTGITFVTPQSGSILQSR